MQQVSNWKRLIGTPLFGAFFVGFAVAAVGLSGCGSTPTDTAQAKTPSDPTAPSAPSTKRDDHAGAKAADPTAVPDAGSPQPTNPTDATTGTTDKPASQTAPVAPPVASKDVVAKSLKGVGFDYYGLDNKNPIDLVMVIPNEKLSYTGSATAVLMSAKGDKAKYAISRSGQLKDLLGDEEVEVRPDGIYATGNTKGKLDQATLDLPANPKPGFTWQVKSVLTTKDEKIKQNIKCTVVGVVPVKDQGKTVQALLVSTKGTVTLRGKASPTTAKYWYEKGVGLIRTELTVTQGGQKPVVMVMSRPEGAK